MYQSPKPFESGKESIVCSTNNELTNQPCAAEVFNLGATHGCHKMMTANDNYGWLCRLGSGELSHDDKATNAPVGNVCESGHTEADSQQGTDSEARNNISKHNASTQSIFCPSPCHLTCITTHVENGAEREKNDIDLLKEDLSVHHTSTEVSVAAIKPPAHYVVTMMEQTAGTVCHQNPPADLSEASSVPACVSEVTGMLSFEEHTRDSVENEENSIGNVLVTTDSDVVSEQEEDDEYTTHPEHAKEKGLAVLHLISKHKDTTSIQQCQPSNDYNARSSGKVVCEDVRYGLLIQRPFPSATKVNFMQNVGILMTEGSPDRPVNALNCTYSCDDLHYAVGISRMSAGTVPEIPPPDVADVNEMTKDIHACVFEDKICDCKHSVNNLSQEGVTSCDDETELDISFQKHSLYIPCFQRSQEHGSNVVPEQEHTISNTQQSTVCRRQSESSEDQSYMYERNVHTPLYSTKVVLLPSVGLLMTTKVVEEPSNTRKGGEELDIALPTNELVAGFVFPHVPPAEIDEGNKVMTSDTWCKTESVTFQLEICDSTAREDNLINYLEEATMGSDINSKMKGGENQSTRHAKEPVTDYDGAVSENKLQTATKVSVEYSECWCMWV